eukprot:8092789-Pyramimonas_sp.AAC.1
MLLHAALELQNNPPRHRIFRRYIRFCTRMLSSTTTATPFTPDKASWADASPESFEKLFMPGISERKDSDEATWSEDAYLLKPVSGWLEYVRRGESEKLVKEEPAHFAKLHLTAVSLQLSDEQFKQARRLAEVRPPRKPSAIRAFSFSAAASSACQLEGRT